VTVVFLAGMAWGAAFSIALLVLVLRGARKHAFTFVMNLLRSIHPMNRVIMFDLMFAKYCIHCGTERVSPMLTCPLCESPLSHTTPQKEKKS
jgi:hypothetical protein